MRSPSGVMVLCDEQHLMTPFDSERRYKHGVGRVIADHAQSKAGKGIWDVGQFRPDMVGFLVTPKETYQYTCVQVCRVNVHSTCYTLDGIGVYPRRSTDIMCVSCANAKGTENYLAIFKYKGDLH